MGTMNPTGSVASAGSSTLLTLIARRYSTEEAVRDLFELIRWPDGPVCPHCGNADSDRIYKIVPNPDKKIRAGVHKCAECREEFTVTVGTVMESSKIPLTKWLFGFYMMCASKTSGVSPPVAAPARYWLLGGRGGLALDICGYFLPKEPSVHEIEPTPW